MTSRERLLTVIKGGIPDRVPATVHQWQAFHLRNYMHCDDELAAFLTTGLDAIIYPPSMPAVESPAWRVTRQEKQRESESREMNLVIATPEGILRQKSVASDYTVSEVEHLVKNREDIYLIEKYWPVPKLDREAVLARKDKLGQYGIYRSFSNGPQGSPWQDACFFCGTENMIYHACDHPDWTHEFLEILFQKKMAFYKQNLFPGIFDMIETGGGAASNTVISPSMFKEFCLPYDKRQHDLVHNIDPNIAVSYHTCGGMMKLLDLIPQNGCDFSETLSPTGCGGDIRDRKDEKTIKDILGSKVKLMGGINQIQVLTYGTRKDIYRDVERAFKGYGENGGYIMMCSDHFFHAPLENLNYYARAAADIGRYY